MRRCFHFRLEAKQLLIGKISSILKGLLRDEVSRINLLAVVKEELPSLLGCRGVSPDEVFLDKVSGQLVDIDEFLF